MSAYACGGPGQRDDAPRADADAAPAGGRGCAAAEPHRVRVERVGDEDPAGQPDQLGDRRGVGDRAEVVGRAAGGGARAAPRPRPPRPGSRRRASSGTGRAAPRAAGRCRPSRPGSGWRPPGTAAAPACRYAVDGDVALLHHLQQRRLGLRRGPVDLVGEHDVGEHRPRVELELRVAWLKMVTPVTSEGSRSGVNWMRRHCPCTLTRRSPGPAWSCRRRARPRAAGGPRRTARSRSSRITWGLPSTTELDVAGEPADQVRRRRDLLGAGRTRVVLAGWAAPGGGSGVLTVLLGHALNTVSSGPVPFGRSNHAYGM